MIIKNQIKTVVLLGALTGLLLGIGQLLGGKQGLIIGLVLAILMNFISFWFSDKIILKIYRAKQVKENEQPGLYAIVREVAKSANIPMPKTYIIPSNTSNAFAVGRNYKHSAVACTEGILNLLSKEELKAVIAHEISHIKNRDTLIATIAATIAGVISYVAFMARFSAVSGEGRDRGNMLGLLLLAILTPIIATIVQLAISRSREYLADESGARLIHNSAALASALQRLNEASKRNPLRFGSEAGASIFIVNPFFGRSLINLFSTHPRIEDRVKKLREMKV